MEPALLLVGAVLLVLGAVGATVSQRRLEADGRPGLALLSLIPFGVLVGAGASMVRGWNLWAAITAGAVLVPLVGAAGRILEVRRARRRRDGTGSPT